MKNTIIPLLILVAMSMQHCDRDICEISVDSLKCNNLDNPAGTGNSPVLSWMINTSERGSGQSACQVILDSDIKNLEPDYNCTWNSGKVEKYGTPSITYNGPSLKSGTKYFWKVRVWDNSGKESRWSKTAFFITGLTGQNDWEGARWIGYEDIPDSMLLVPGIQKGIVIEGETAKKRTVVPIFRKEIILEKKVRQSFVFVSGLGHYELFINGKKIGNRFLSPGWTHYNSTSLYNTFDVTDELTQGSNVIGAIVGNGFYNINRERYYKLVITYGAPKLILKMKIIFTDGSEKIINSDESWKVAGSPVTFTSIFGGEDYDARLEQPGWNDSGFNDSNWQNAILVREPIGKLKPESDFPVMVMQTFDPINIFKPDSDSYVYDFGQNASGIIKLKIEGKRGQEVRLIPGELIGDDSLVAQRASGRPYYFSYILKSDKEEAWIPRFTYYGFRFVQAEGAVPEGEPNPSGLPEITGLQFLHTRNSSPVIGTFKCSNELFNSIYNLINWAIKSNLASVATDCPHREKLGWLEQTHLMGNSIKYVYDIHNLYNKMIDDMMEAQLENGLVPTIAPEYVLFAGGFRDSPEWSSACIILPWDMYEWYGDIEAMQRAYPMMKRYLKYLDDTSVDHILSNGLGDWYDLGPKSPGVAQLTPKELTATAIFYYDAILMSKMSALLGEKEDSADYINLAEKIRIAFNNKFFDPVSKVYSTGSQTAYSMPLFFGMVDDSCKKEVVANLVKSIRENNNALTAGDVGYRYLLRTLEQEEKSQLIYEMTSKTDVPGYGYQLSKGATALTESWAGLKNVSNNHMMLGHLMEWFYSGPGGIRQAEGSKGYENILIKPEPVGDIKWAETTYQTIHGEILCSWKIVKDSFIVKVRIPPNCKASVEIPQPDTEKIQEGGRPLSLSQGVSRIVSSGNHTTISITSGEYLFKSFITR